MHRISRAVASRLICCAVLLVVAAAHQAVPAAESQPANAREPFSAVVNVGQWDDSVLASVRAGGTTIWLTVSAVLLDRTVPIQPLTTSSVNATQTDQFARRLTSIGFRGANFTASQVGLQEIHGSCNYLFGSDPAQWVTDVPMGRVVVCSDVYPGIDLVLSAGGSSAPIHFRLKSGADPASVQFATAEDAKSDGLRLSHREGQVDLIMPTDVEAANSGPAAAGVTYGTYLGGTGYDAIYAMAVGTDGAIYVAGNTESANFPTVSPYDPSYNAGTFGDVFLTKFSADGSMPIYSTFIGGAGPDILAGLAVDVTGRAHMTGITGSLGTFPIVSAYDSTYAGSGDAFIMRLSSAGNAIEFSTYVGGIAEDYPRGIAIDALGNSYIAGHTRSHDFPTAGGLDPDFNGGNYDAFVVKLSVTGAALDYSSYLGGSGDDQAFGIAVDPAGRAHVRGWTVSGNFPTVNALDADFNGGDRDVFLARINSLGSALEYSTYLGGGDSDYGVGISIDDSGCVYLAGATRSADFPMLNAYDATIGGLQDLFVLKVDSNGQSLIFSTFLGGSAEDFNGLATVDRCGHVFVTGYTYSEDFPLVLPIDGDFAAGSDLVVAGFSVDGTQLAHSTYFGGTEFEFVNAIVLRGGKAYIAGVSNSTDLPVVDAYTDTLTGDYDGFITILDGIGVNDCGCVCDCAADPVCDGIRSDVVDVVQVINVAFRGAAAILDPSPTCPGTPTDVNCSGATDVIDVVKTVSVAFRGASPAAEYCDPCTQ